MLVLIYMYKLMVALATPVIEMQVTDQTKEAVTEIVASTFPVMQVGNVH